MYRDSGFPFIWFQHRTLVLMWALLTLLAVIPGFTGVDILDSGGPLTPQQAAYDVHFYDLHVAVFPEEKRISGTVMVKATMVHPFDWLVLNLDTVFSIQSIQFQQGGKWDATLFQQNGGELWIYLNGTRQPGDTVAVKITYEGHPREARRAPWEGGFTWAHTPSGAPWIATTCQEEGADIWWPVKDHVSDEPDSMAIHVTVPRGLFCASNGQLVKIDHHANHTTTFHWRVRNPINTYNVALNIAPYQQYDTTFVNSTGDTIPVFFWVLPEDASHGHAFLKEIIRQLQFFERYLGPYPFRAEKCGVVQTPHLGMEHQTVIAYGAQFNNAVLTGKDWGFDALLHHEMSHEWWGNLVTNFDWKDMWLHEGFGTYMQALYVEALHGDSAYLEIMKFYRRFSNRLPVAPRESQTAGQIYKAPIYYKGAWILHTLRYVMGDSLFFTALRRMAYPTPELERVMNGRQCRFATTDDFLLLVNQLTGKDFSWFFEVYLRQPQLPQLIIEPHADAIVLRWKTPQNLPFPMPLDVTIGHLRQRITIPKKGIHLPITPDDTLLIDPDQRVLFAYGQLRQAEQLINSKQYKAAHSVLTPLLKVTNLRFRIEALLQHIQFLQQYKSDSLLAHWYGKYQKDANTFIIFSKTGMLTNRRSFEAVWSIAPNQVITRDGRYIYQFKEDARTGNAWLEKKSRNGKTLFRAFRSRGD